MPLRLVVLISGNGSNLQAILDACASGELDATVVSVISNKAEAYGLTRAKNAGIESTHFPKLENESRNEYDARLAVFPPSFFYPSQIVSSIYTPPCPKHFPAHIPLNALTKHINAEK